MAGILWMLFVTGTTLNVPSLMGAIMCIGVATANSILIVTFANDERPSLPLARDAMLSAGIARLRPVLMTAAAMMLGMLPMALGLPKGGVQPYHTGIMELNPFITDMDMQRWKALLPRSVRERQSWPVTSLMRRCRKRWCHWR